MSVRKLGLDILSKKDSLKNGHLFPVWFKILMKSFAESIHFVRFSNAFKVFPD